MEPKSLTDINHSFYINLDTRTDRREHVEKQLASIGIVPNRFNAIKLGNGAIGCSMSHLKCLQYAKSQSWDHVLICEDDIEFLDPELFKKQINRFLQLHKYWDVLLLAGNSIPPYIEIGDYCVKVSQCLTTTGYIVRSHYYDTLIQNISEGVSKFMKNPDQGFTYSIDKYWIQLQMKAKWYLITPLTVCQRADYSDIEKKETNYSHLLLDLDKTELIEKSRKKAEERKALEIEKEKENKKQKEKDD